MSSMRWFSCAYFPSRCSAHSSHNKYPSLPFTKVPHTSFSLQIICLFFFLRLSAMSGRVSIGDFEDRKLKCFWNTCYCLWNMTKAPLWASHSPCSHLQNHGVLGRIQVLLQNLMIRNKEFHSVQGHGGHQNEHKHQNRRTFSPKLFLFILVSYMALYSAKLCCISTTFGTEHESFPWRLRVSKGVNTEHDSFSIAMFQR